MNIISLAEEDYFQRLNSPHNPPSREVLGEAFDSEYYRLYDLVKSVMKDYGENDAYGEGDYNLEPHIADSRGLGFEISNESIISERLLLSLQGVLVHHAPEWEIFLGSALYEFGIFIGPGSIWMHRLHDGILPQLNAFLTSPASAQIPPAAP
jgi:hypothetical protein